MHLQTEGVFNRTLQAIKNAGAVLVPFNASSVVEYNDKYIGDPTLYTTELGGALSRCSPGTSCVTSVPVVSDTMPLLFIMLKMTEPITRYGKHAGEGQARKF